MAEKSLINQFKRLLNFWILDYALLHGTAVSSYFSQQPSCHIFTQLDRLPRCRTSERQLQDAAQ